MSEQKKAVVLFLNVTAGNISENLLNEIRQIIYSLHREKVSNNIMNSIKL